MSPIGEAALVLMTIDERRLSQINLPGRKVAVRALPDPVNPAILAFTVYRKQLHAFLVKLRVDSGARLDTIAHSVLYDSPVPVESDWDVGVGIPGILPNGNIALILTAGWALAPRGMVELDRQSLEIVQEFYSGAKLMGMGIDQRTGRILAGSHGAENGAFVGGISDTSGYLVTVNRHFEPSFEKRIGRTGSVGIEQATDSTFMALVRGDVPREGSILEVDLNRSPRIRELMPLTDSLLSMVVGQWSADRVPDAAFSTWRGGLYILDGVTGRIRSRTRVGNGSIQLKNLPGGGANLRDHLVASGTNRTVLFDSELRPLAVGPSGIRIDQRLSEDTFLGTVDGKTSLVKIEPDSHALKARRDRWLFFALIGLALLLSNGIVWRFGRRQHSSVLRTDLYAFLVNSGSSDSATLDSLVEIRDALKKHSHKESLSVQALAEAAGYASIREMNAVVSRATGHTSRSLIEDYRLHRASVLLTSSDQPIEQIAETVGFRSHQYFTTRFKKAFLVTPSDYRSAASAEPKID